MRDYNFFEIYDNKKKFSLNPRSPFFIGGIVVLVCVLLSIGLILRNRILLDNIESATEKWLRTKSSQEYISADKLQNSLDAMEDYEKNADIALGKFSLANFINSKLIADLFKELPSNVVVTDFDLKGLDLRITCDAPNRETAAELLLGLKQTGLFEMVKLDSVVTNEDNFGSVVRINGILKAGEAE